MSDATVVQLSEAALFEGARRSRVGALKNAGGIQVFHMFMNS